MRDGRGGGRWRWVGWAVGAAAVDQLTKVWIQTRLAPGASVAVWGEGLRLTHLHNDGAAFGLLPGRSGLFVAGTLTVLGLAVIWSLRRKPASRWVTAGIGLLAGGAVGNLLDRVRQGSVVDFIDVGFWPVFNLADAAIVTGLALLFWQLSGRRRPRGEHAGRYGRV